MEDLHIMIVDSVFEAQDAKDFFLSIDNRSVIYLAENENKAWSLLQKSIELKSVPKVLILDSSKEDINGLELLRKIRNHPSLKSILVFVLADSDKNKEEVLELNVAGFIHKPLDKNQLKEVFSVINEYLSIIVFPRNSI